MSIGTILIVTVIFAISMISKVKKVAEEQAAPQGHPAVPGQDDDDSDQAYEAPQEENPYFTYESDAENTVKKPAAPRTYRQAPATVMAAVADEPARPQFDLRQAVISQVILDNKYIDEINQ